MAQKKQEKKKEGIDIDFNIGNFSLGGLFKGIEHIMELAEKMEDSSDEIRKEGEIDLGHLKKGLKGVYGFSIKTAVGGKPVVEPFGNIRNTPKGPKIEEEREPIVDIFNEKSEIRVYAEMPGINTGDIKLDLNGDILDISAQTEDRKYHKEILLPLKINPDTMTFTHKNGILEVKMGKLM